MTASAALDERDDDVTVEPVWTVAAVAERLGISPSTLRTWGRRYGIGPAGHHPGRHRRYTDADVTELETMRRLIDQGVTLTAAAAIAREQRPAAPGADTVGSWAEQISLLTAAARRLDSAAATAIVGSAVRNHGVVPTWDELCRPAMIVLTADEETTAEGDVVDACVDVVLLLQWSVATSLRRLPGSRRPPVAGPVLLACADGEHHTLAVEALLAALQERDVDARMLGPSVPDFAVLAASSTVRPDSVVIWSQTTDTAAPELVRALIDTVATVVAAGPGWDAAVLHPAVRRCGGLVEALALAGAPELLPAT